jgi:hypothetical protein
VWGDTVGYFTDGAWDPPNNVVEILDALALIDGFRHARTAPPVTWSDTYPEVPDYRIDILDVVMVIDAFRVRPYFFGPPVDCP